MLKHLYFYSSEKINGIETKLYDYIADIEIFLAATFRLLFPIKILQTEHLESEENFYFTLNRTKTVVS